MSLEAGWIVTEVGRQPWIVYRVMLVSDAVTPSRGVPVTLGVILALYAILTVVSIGASAASRMKWSPSARVRLATERTIRSPHRIS